MIYFIIRYRFYLPDKNMVGVARKEFGDLLKKLNLRYKSEKCHHGYLCTGLQDSRPWELDFLILPEEYQQDTYLEALQLLNESYLKPFLALHRELGDVSIYRNLLDFPALIHTTSGWWK